MTDLIAQIAAPVATGLLGWFTNAYRNRQRRENDIIDNIKRILDIQDKKIEAQDARIVSLEQELKEFQWIVRQAYECNAGDGACPVLRTQYEIGQKKQQKKDEDK